MSSRVNQRASYLADVWQDLFYATRALWRQPGFTVVAVLTLALGIGANSAIFSLLDRLLLSAPPHIQAADRVVRLLMGESGAGPRFAMSTTSYATFVELQNNTRSFSDLAATTTGSVVLGQGGDATAIQGAKVTGNYFRLLGTQPAAGRFLGEEDDRLPSGLEVVVLSHAFWRRQLAGDPGALGREIILDDRPFVIVGIAPPGFTGDGIEPIDVWIPLNAGMRSQPGGWRENRLFNVVALLARLKDGTSEAAAQQDATRVYRSGRETYERAEDAAQSQISFLPLIAAVGPDGLTQEGRIALWLGGVALAVFLIAVGNVTNLLLLRTARRQSEVAVRLALGMSRGRLVRLWVTESLLLAFLGGGVGLLVAHWGGNLMRLTLLPGMAPTETPLQARVFVVTAVAAMAAGLFSGLLPARQAGATSLARLLSPAALARSVRRSPLLTTLLLLQTGLSAVLLSGAGLFVASLYNVQTQNMGFTTERTLLAQVPLGPGGKLQGAERDAFYRDAMERIKLLPGVEMVIPVNALPFGAHNIPPISVPGLDGAPGEDTQLPFMNAATPDYFRMMGMTVLRGRGFTAVDDERSPLVVVVNDTMARTIWPNENAIGKCIRIGYAEGGPPTMEASPSLPCREIVGIANDARRRSIRPEDMPIMEYYVPFEQMPMPPFPGVPTISGLLIRTAGDPRSMVRPIQQTMQSGSSDAPYVSVHPYQDLI
ncbi:MAG TPA: ABC transporter permease, partial [Gemmatimonadales bacterium]|nr:ABC transporter permease [Gemmatimonadales bacterium]